MNITNIIVIFFLISCTHIHGATTGKNMPSARPGNSHIADIAKKAEVKELKVEIDLVNHVKHEFAVKKTITLPYNPLASQTATLTKALVPNSELITMLQIVTRNFGDSYTVILSSYIKSKDKKDEFDPLATHYLKLAHCQEGEIAMTGQYRFRAKVYMPGIPCKANGPAKKTPAQ